MLHCGQILDFWVNFVEFGFFWWIVALRAEGPLRRLRGGSVKVVVWFNWGGGRSVVRWRGLKFLSRFWMQVFVVDYEGCRAFGGE